MAENDSDNEALTTRKFQERQRCRAEKKREEEQKKAEEEWKCTEEAKRVEEVRKAVEVKKAEEARKVAEAKKATTSARGRLTMGGGAKCEGCESMGMDCTMEMPSGSKATACDCCRGQKMGCVRPGVEKKECWRKQEEPMSLQGGSKRKQTWVQSPEEVKEMWWEYWEQGKWVVTAINNLQHMLDPEFVVGPEEESDPKVSKEEMVEALVELGELRKEVEEAAVEPEDEESEEEESNNGEV
ncbi:hypothetical protein HYDPIDRAFT_31472 [Hydnomerulius pinastri MD-312]|uniref:Uncharacterized protein n=1 Tax=Hydnomerulius pinastri MD-312 TaxID=994086 RepID=A0A0C9W4I1_9AGAM|nr:hypothetical protein HYDPIDRAFT_31472 [Hydnomerulius pinastri MD-312]